MERTRAAKRVVAAVAAAALAVVVVVAIVHAVVDRGGRRTRTLSWPGTVEVRLAAVGSKLGGRIASVLAAEGDRVRAGDAIVELEAGDYDAQRAAQAAIVDEARVQLARVTTKGTAAPARAAVIAAAEARVVEANATYDKASADVSRLQRLFALGAVTRVELDDAVTAKETAEARRSQQAQSLAQLRAGTKNDVDEASAALRSAQARLHAFDVTEKELIVRAARNGVVQTLSLRPGDILAPNAPAATILEDDQLYLRVFVPETQLGYVRVGDVVSVRIDTFPRARFRGVVAQIASEGEFTPRNLETADQRANQVFAVRVNVVDPERVLKAGMAAFVDVEVPR